MTIRQITSGQAAAVLKAVTNLTAIEWNLPTFHLDSAHEVEWERHAQALRDLEYGREMSELEESYERSRWFRTQAMIRNLDWFNQFCGSCAVLLNELTMSGWQSRLGIRAGLREAAIDERPSSLIEFKPELPPKHPPLSRSEYEGLLGGPHVFGARLIWWCAASKSPNRFGYSSGFSHQIWTQPFWYGETAQDVCSVNRGIAELVLDAANFVARNDEQLKSEKIIEAPENGPSSGRIFYWNSKAIKLQPIQYRLMELLWDEWKNGTDRVAIETAAGRVWGTDDVSDSNCWSHASKLSKKFLMADIPIGIAYQDAHFVIEVRSPKA